MNIAFRLEIFQKMLELVTVYCTFVAVYVLLDSVVGGSRNPPTPVSLLPKGKNVGQTLMQATKGCSMNSCVRFFPSCKVFDYFYLSDFTKF